MSEAKTKFNGAVEHFQSELKKLRTGRPSLDSFENIDVEAYGSKAKLNGVASINIVDATLVTIQPWDKTLIQEIQKSLQATQSQYNPQIAGDLIRVPIPPMTMERREESVKKLKELAEQCRIQIRVMRKDLISDLDEQKKLNLLTEDEYKAAEKELQTDVDAANKQVEEISHEKETTLMTV